MKLVAKALATIVLQYQRLLDDHARLLLTLEQTRVIQSDRFQSAKAGDVLTARYITDMEQVIEEIFDFYGTSERVQAIKERLGWK